MSILELLIDHGANVDLALGEVSPISIFFFPFLMLIFNNTI